MSYRSTRWAQALENGAHRLVQCTKLQFVKIAIYVNHSKTKHNKMFIIVFYAIEWNILYVTVRFIWSIVYSNSSFPYWLSSVYPLLKVGYEALTNSVLLLISPFSSVNVSFTYFNVLILAYIFIIAILSWYIYTLIIIMFFVSFDYFWLQVYFI